MKYFYSWGLLFVLPFTIYFYIKSHKSIRIKMLVSGLGFGILAFVFSYIFLDYWEPVYLINNIHIEDFIYGFIFVGILPGIFNSINKTKLVKKYKINIKLSIIYFVIVAAIYLILIVWLKLNSIYFLSVAPLIVGIIACKVVDGKIINIFVTSLYSLIITIIVYSIIIYIYPYVIYNHFILESVSGIMLFNIPIEESLFAICIGVAATYTYESIFNLREKKIGG